MDKYELFVSAVKHGSISGAAEALHYTQSGVSYAIAALEKEIGFKLLKRQKSGVTLTPKGEHFFPLVLAIVNQQRRLDQEVDALQNTIAGTLRLGSFPSVTSVWLPFLLRDFQERYPEVHFELTDGDYEEVAGLLREERLDCAFLPRAVVRAPLSFYPLYNDHLYAVLPQGHPLTKKKAVKVDDFLSYPLINQNFGNDAVVSELMERAQRTPDVRYTLRDDLSITMLVEAGHGVSFLGGLYRRLCPADVVFRPFDPPGSRQIGLAVSDPRQLTAAAAAFLTFVREYDLVSLSS